MILFSKSTSVTVFALVTPTAATTYDWLLTACLLLVLTIGFAKLAVIATNRFLAEKWPKPTVVIVELTQFALMLLYALLLFDHLRNNGFSRAIDLKNGETFAWITRGLIGLGLVGLYFLIHSAISFQRYQPPHHQIAEHSTTIDFRNSEPDSSWKETLVGLRPMRWVALLPGNQQFTIEVATKTYVLSRLPEQWDGLSIVHLADTHFRGAVTRSYFEQVCEQAIALKPDLFVFTGDLLDDVSRLDWFATTFGRLKAPLGQYYVLGNHDWYLDVPKVRREFGQHGWIDLAGRTFELESLTAGPSILLAGDETPWMGEHPAIDPNSRHPFRILVSHTPDNISWSRANGLDLMLAGHTHGGQIRLPILGPIHCPSRYGVKYSAGIYWLDPTLLCVSRGISGREPIRYGCRPELTKLVLRSSRNDHPMPKPRSGKPA